MWGSRQGIMGYQTGDDGMPGRGTVAALASHQSGISSLLEFFIILLIIVIALVKGESIIFCIFFYYNIKKS